MSRTTRKAEFVRAALECIAYQITDVVNAMSEDAEKKIKKTVRITSLCLTHRCAIVKEKAVSKDAKQCSQM